MKEEPSFQSEAKQKPKSFRQKLLKWTGISLLVCVGLVVIAEPYRQQAYTEVDEEVRSFFAERHSSFLGDETAQERWDNLLPGENGYDAWQIVCNEAKRIFDDEDTIIVGDESLMDVANTVTQWKSDRFPRYEMYRKENVETPSDEMMQQWLSHTEKLYGLAEDVLSFDYVAYPSVDADVQDFLTDVRAISVLSSRIYVLLATKSIAEAEASLASLLKLSVLFRGPCEEFENAKAMSIREDSWMLLKHFIQRDIASDKILQVAASIELDRTSYLKQFITRIYISNIAPSEYIEEGDFSGGWFDWTQHIFEDPFRSSNYGRAFDLYIDPFLGIEGLAEIFDSQLAIIETLNKIDGPEPLVEVIPVSASAYDIPSVIDWDTELAFAEFRAIQLAAKVLLAQRATSDTAKLKAEVDQLAEATPKVAAFWEEEAILIRLARWDFATNRSSDETDLSLAAQTPPQTPQINL